jgi:hypothetical protein
MNRSVVVLLALAAAGCATVEPVDTGTEAGGVAVVLCHKGKRTMELPEEATESHLSHGDHLGPC